MADDTTAVDDRVAAALVVLYAQPLARIAVLKASDVHRSPDGTVIVDLAGNPVPIHEPFATLIGQLPHRRSNGMSDQPGTPWLFPGRHAGRHAGPVVLGERMRAMGIEPIRMRNTARAQLAADTPPALLGEIIGVNATIATRWTALTAGNLDRLRRWPRPRRRPGSQRRRAPTPITDSGVPRSDGRLTPDPRSRAGF